MQTRELKLKQTHFVYTLLRFQAPAKLHALPKSILLTTFLQYKNRKLNAHNVLHTFHLTAYTFLILHILYIVAHTLTQKWDFLWFCIGIYPLNGTIATTKRCIRNTGHIENQFTDSWATKGEATTFSKSFLILNCIFSIQILFSKTFQRDSPLK